MRLEERITDISVVNVSIIMYMLGYAIKMTAFFNGVFIEVIPKIQVRIISSMLLALTVSQILMAVSVSMSNKILAPVLAFLDSILLMFVLDVFSEGITTLERIKRIFIALFLSFIFYLLIEVFKIKKKQIDAKLEQEEANEKLKEMYNAF